MMGHMVECFNCGSSEPGQRPGCPYCSDTPESERSGLPLNGSSALAHSDLKAERKAHEATQRELERARAERDMQERRKKEHAACATKNLARADRAEARLAEVQQRISEVLESLPGLLCKRFWYGYLSADSVARECLRIADAEIRRIRAAAIGGDNSE